MIVMTLSERARSLALLGRLQEARAAAQETLDAVDPELPFTDTLIARYQLQLGRYQARLNEIEAAQEQLELAEPMLDRPQCQPEALKAAWFEVRAEVYSGEGEPEKAIKDLRSAVALRESAAQTFMGGEEYASASTAQTLKRLLGLQRKARLDSDATGTRLQLEALCERFRFPLRLFC